MRHPKLVVPDVKYDTIQCRGGWDEITPTLSLKSGIVRDCLNYEIATTGGYSRIAGYERFDGRAKPSDAAYTLQQVVAFVNTPTVGQVLTGGTSGATSVIIAVGALYVAVTNIVGSYVDGENLNVGATLIGTKTPTTTSLSALIGAQYTNLAADVYRAFIGPVPGSGPVRGVQLLNGVLYAFRDNAGGTAVDIYKESAAGWVNVPLFEEVRFTLGGTAVPIDGEVITQGAFTATVKRVMDETGSWAAGDCAGRFIITTPTGAFAAGAATLSGGTGVTLSGASTPIVIATGGRYEFEEKNFYGQLSGKRLYGADGANRMFEFDGTVYAPINTNTVPDIPKHVKVFKRHLFGSFGSSIIHSGVGAPYRFNATAGGSEIATGDTVTGMLIQPGTATSSALGVFCRNSTNILYGSSSADWNLTPFEDGTGAFDYSCQNLTQSYVLDDRGVIGMAATQAYGNFTQATLTNSIKNFISSKRTLVSSSMINRERSQYRLFFNDSTALFSTIVNGKYLGSMRIQYAVAAYCSCNGELLNGDEASFIGGTDGYVYQIDKGSSLDGADIHAYLTFVWNTSGSPRTLKRYRKASIEMQGNYYSQVRFGYSLGYGSTEEMQPDTADYTSNFSSANWDSFTWDNFFWDGQTLAPIEVAMEGSAENVQITIASTYDYLYPSTINSIIIHYTPRRGIR